MSKLIMIILDGLHYQAARQCLGFLEGLVVAKQAGIHKLQCELPAMSRPLYETILTGRRPVEHGIVSNSINRRSYGDNLFQTIREAGKTTAAAAYHWVSELYVKTPFDIKSDRWLFNGDGNISYGSFYNEDHYPDSHLFADAHFILSKFAPDFLLLHPMNIDDVGHKNGGDSIAYRNSARLAGDLIAQYVPQWREAGYKIIITADHGMGHDGNHCGADEFESSVPFYTLGFDIAPSSFQQTQIAGLCCKLLGIKSHNFPSFNGDVQ